MIEIRFALPEEAESIADVLRTAFAEFESFYTPEAFAATTPSAEKIRARFDEEGAIWAALKNKEIVGTVSAVPREERLYFRSMAVVPSAQGFGIGRLLLETVEKYAIENGFEKMSLVTTPFLKDAIRLYEQSGFESDEIKIDGFFGTPWFAMRKKLSKTGKIL